MESPFPKQFRSLKYFQDTYRSLFGSQTREVPDMELALEDYYQRLDQFSPGGASGYRFDEQSYASLALRPLADDFMPAFDRGETPENSLELKRRILDEALRRLMNVVPEETVHALSMRRIADLYGGARSLNEHDVTEHTDWLRRVLRYLSERELVMGDYKTPLAEINMVRGGIAKEAERVFSQASLRLKDPGVIGVTAECRKLMDAMIGFIGVESERMASRTNIPSVFLDVLKVYAEEMVRYHLKRNVKFVKISPRQLRPDVRPEELVPLIEEMMKLDVMAGLMEYLDVLVPKCLIDLNEQDSADEHECRLTTRIHFGEGGRIQMLHAALKGFDEMIGSVKFQGCEIADHPQDVDFFDPTGLAVVSYRSQQEIFMVSLRELRAAFIRQSQRGRLGLATDVTRAYFTSKFSERVERCEKVLYPAMVAELEAWYMQHSAMLCRSLDDELVKSNADNLSQLYRSAELLREKWSQLVASDGKREEQKGVNTVRLFQPLLKKLQESAERQIKITRQSSIAKLKVVYHDRLTDFQSKKEQYERDGGFTGEVHDEYVLGMRHAKTSYLATLYQLCTGEVIPEMAVDVINEASLQHFATLTPVMDIRLSQRLNLEMSLSLKYGNKYNLEYEVCEKDPNHARAARMQETIISHMVTRMLMHQRKDGDSGAEDSELEEQITTAAREVFEQLPGYDPEMQETLDQQYYSLFLDALSYRMVVDFGGTKLLADTKGERQKNFLGSFDAVIDGFLETIERLRPEEVTDAALIQLLRFVMTANFIAQADVGTKVSKSYVEGFMQKRYQNLTRVFQEFCQRPEISSRMKAFIGANFDQIMMLGFAMYQQGLDYRFPNELPSK